MIPLFKVNMAPSAKDAVGKVLDSGYIGEGPVVKDFESDLAQFFGHPYPVTVNSATSGLMLALRLISDSRGSETRDEVLAPSLSCTATNWPILAAGKHIKWVDTSVDTCNVDYLDMVEKLSPRTLAIMVVHWGGYPCDLITLNAVQEKCLERYGFRPLIIEDCAHAMGSTYGRKMIGTHGNFCVFSFQAIKHLTSVDGGALLCPSGPGEEHWTDRARDLRWYGMDRTKSADFRCANDVVSWGYKFHMNDVSAAVGRENLKCLPVSIAAHQANAAFYRGALDGVNGIKLLASDPDRASACWLFTLRAQERDGLQRYLKEHGVASSRVHNRNDVHSCVRQYQDNKLSGTGELCSDMLCIPVGWWVTENDREKIVSLIRKGW